MHQLLAFPACWGLENVLRWESQGVWVDLQSHVLERGVSERGKDEEWGNQQPLLQGVVRGRIKDNWYSQMLIMTEHNSKWKPSSLTVVKAMEDFRFGSHKGSRGKEVKARLSPILTSYILWNWRKDNCSNWLPPSNAKSEWNSLALYLHSKYSLQVMNRFWDMKGNDGSWKQFYHRLIDVNNT